MMFNIEIKGGKTVGNLDVEKYVLNKEMMQDTQKVLFDCHRLCGQVQGSKHHWDLASV